MIEIIKQKLNSRFGQIVKTNVIITFYFIQVFMILIYLQPEIQEFVYVRF